MVKTNGTRYSPAFKFRVVPEAQKAEGKGAEGQVAWGPANTLGDLGMVAGFPMGKTMLRTIKTCHASPVTRHGSACRHSCLDYWLPVD